MSQKSNGHTCSADLASGEQNVQWLSSFLQPQNLQQVRTEIPAWCTVSHFMGLQCFQRQADTIICLPRTWDPNLDCIHPAIYSISFKKVFSVRAGIKTSKLTNPQCFKSLKKACRQSFQKTSINMQFVIVLSHTVYWLSWLFPQYFRGCYKCQHRREVGVSPLTNGSIY